jgi:hypothetical protein
MLKNVLLFQSFSVLVLLLGIEPLFCESQSTSTVETNGEISSNMANSGVSRFWGRISYSTAVDIPPQSVSPGDWSTLQDSGLQLNWKGSSGIEVVVDLSAELGSGAPQTIISDMQQLYFQFAPVENITVVAGKQRFKWGTGKVFSAIDRGEPQENPVDPFMLPDGVVGVSAEIIPADWFGVSCIIIPDTSFRWAQFGSRADFTWVDANLDLGVGVFKYRYQPLISGESSSSPYSQDSLDRVAVSADGAWGMGDLTLYGELELHRGRESGYWLTGMVAPELLASDYQNVLVVKSLAGMMIQLDCGLTRPVSLIAEYLFNSDGLNASEAAKFTEQYNRGSKGDSTSSSIYSRKFGSFRQEYLAIGINSIVLDRHSTGELIETLGLDSGLLVTTAAVNVDVVTDLTLKILFTHFDSAYSTQDSEIVFSSYRNQFGIKLSAGF